MYVLLSGTDGGSGHSACAMTRSDDAGRTWSEPTVIATSVGQKSERADGAPSAGWAAHALAVDVSDVDRVYVTLASSTDSERTIHVATSRDGGATFELVALASPGHASPRGVDSQEFADVASVAPGVVGIASASIAPSIVRHDGACSRAASKASATSYARWAKNRWPSKHFRNVCLYEKNSPSKAVTSVRVVKLLPSTCALDTSCAQWATAPTRSLHFAKAWCSPRHWRKRVHRARPHW